MTRAIPWDGIGPKEECLLRIQWKHDGDEEWIHVFWQEADWEQDEDGYHGHNDRYIVGSGDFSVVDSTSSGRFEPNDGFTVLYYAALPTIARVIDLTERQRNDADEGAATV
jgi:hypothetical protein